MLLSVLLAALGLLGLGARGASAWQPPQTTIAVAGRTYPFGQSGTELLDEAFKPFIKEHRDKGAHFESLAREAVREAVLEHRLAEWSVIVNKDDGGTCALPLFKGLDVSTRVPAGKEECGPEHIVGEVADFVKEYRFMPVLSFDVTVPGHRDPLVFRLWEGQRLAEVVPAFLAEAGVDVEAHEPTLMEYAEQQTFEAGLFIDPPALWVLPPDFPQAGFEPDQTFMLRDDMRVTDATRPARHALDWSAKYGVVLQAQDWFCNGHYYHAVECLLGLFTWSREYGGPDRGWRRVEVAVVDPAAYNPPIHDFFVSALFPGARVVTSGNGRLDAAVVASKHGMALNLPRTAVRINKALEHSVLPATAWFPEFYAAVCRAAGATPKARPSSPGELRAVYVRRPHSLRELSDEDIVRLETLMLVRHGVALEVMQFDAMTVAEQVRLSAHVNLMVGVHGNGLTNLLWMPRHGAVMELFAADWHFYDYQILSEVSKHLYSGVQEGNPFPYRRASRRESVYGLPTFGPTSLDWELVDAEIEFLVGRILHP